MKKLYRIYFSLINLIALFLRIYLLITKYISYVVL